MKTRSSSKKFDAYMAPNSKGKTNVSSICMRDQVFNDLNQEPKPQHGSDIARNFL